MDRKCNNYYNDDRESEVQHFTEIPKGWGYRHQQCLILFCCLTTAYSIRSCMGVTVVAMTTTHTATDIANATTANNDSIVNGELENVKNYIANNNITNGLHIVNEEYNETGGFLNGLMLSPPHPKFPWNKKIQATILSSFFWGYMTLQVPAGQLAHRFGAKYLIFAAMTINSVVSICLPWAALYGGWIYIVILRIVQGLSQACLFPSMHTFLGKWAPLPERGHLTAIVYGGSALGTVLGLPITGFIASSSFGWPGIFRFYGVLSGIVGVLWWYMGSDTPGLHPKISEAERNYIEKALGHDEGKKRLPVPWKSILTYRGLWAIVVAHVGQTWGQLILYSEVPAFMDKVMGVNIKANGLLTALPFLVMWLANFGFSWLTDLLINRRLLSVTNTRKLANTIGCWPPALGLVVLAFAPKNIYVVEGLLVIICGLKISAHLGFQVNHIDIAPNFAGTMMSISNFVSNGVGSFAPIVNGLILTDVTNEDLWSKVFCLTTGMYFFTNLFYVIAGTAEKAEWNDPNKTNEEHEKLTAKGLLEPMLHKK